MKSRITFLVLCLMALPLSMAFAQDSERTTITTDNVENLSILRRIGRGAANTIDWSPDGQYILVGSTVGVWKYEAIALDTATEPQLIPSSGEVDDFDISPDGTTVAIAGSEQGGFYDFESGELIESFSDDLRNGYDVTYSTDGQYLSLNQGSELTVYDVNNAAVYINAESLSLNTTVPVLVTPDNSKILAVGRNNSIYMWDFVEGGEPTELSGHSGTVNDLVVSADGTTALSASDDDTVMVWDLERGESVQTLTQPADDSTNANVTSVAISPDGSTVITGHSNKIRIWDAAGGSITGEASIGNRTLDLEFSPDGSQFVAIVANQANAVQLFNLDGTHVATTFYHNTHIGGVAFSPNSDVLSFNDNDYNLYIWDTAAAPEITESIKIEDGVGFDSMINTIVYTSDNRYMATLRSFDASIRDAATGELIHELDPIVDGLGMDIAFSPDDTMLAFGSSQGLYIVDVESGQLLFYSDAANDWIQSIAWSPDQALLAVASDDNVVRVYAIVEE